MPSSDRTCTVAGCDRKRKTRAHCPGHYQRVAKHGDPLAHLPLKPRGPLLYGAPCSACDTEAACRVEGVPYCQKHYHRVLKFGTTELPPKTYKPHINSNGYVELWVDGRRQLEHRLKMQAHLGRPLYADENVHHINGDRADNRIENLELWATAQPAGQRIPDKVAWAKELLARYEPEALA